MKRKARFLVGQVDLKEHKKSRREQADNLLYDAWCVIANSGVFDNPSTPTDGCKEAAIRWCDKYHEFLSARQK